MEQSTLKSRLRALGPGLMMASAAIGGSHIVASTQAGALYGWQLAVIIILANVFKYPFFRFAYQYTLDSGDTLLEGYMRRGKIYLWIFFILNVFASVISTAAVLLLCASLLKFVLPLPETVLGMKDVTFFCWAVIAVSLLLLLGGRYVALDRVTKLIVFSLTVTTLAAVAVAAWNGPVAPPGFQGPSPWNMATLPFIIALMGWMPAPIEISAITSMWLSARNKTYTVSRADGLFDFDISFIGTALLALVFLALGALVQYGSGTPVESVGGKYLAQFIEMYAATIGGWSRWLVAFIAFACMFGTVITVIDGYARTNTESVRLLAAQGAFSSRALSAWILFIALAGIGLVLLFQSALGRLLHFAMITAFVSAPVFAWLNMAAVRDAGQKIGRGMLWLARCGLVYLAGFALLFIFGLFFL